MCKSHVLILTCGYVEEGHLSSLILQRHRGFTSVKEALESVGRATLKAAERRTNFVADINRCPHCDKPINEPERVDREFLEEMFTDLSHGTLDSSADLVRALGDEGWDMSLDMPPEYWDGMVHVYQNAEVLIAEVMFPDDPQERSESYYELDRNTEKPEDLPWE